MRARAGRRRGAVDRKAVAAEDLAGDDRHDRLIDGENGGTLADVLDADPGVLDADGVAGSSGGRPAAVAGGEPGGEKDGNGCKGDAKEETKAAAQAQASDQRNGLGPPASGMILGPSRRV